jgi:hypothetical protein
MTTETETLTLDLEKPVYVY